MSDLLFQYISENLKSASRSLFVGESFGKGKSYDRYPFLQLEEPVKAPAISLVEALAGRKSTREFSENNMSLSQLSDWLFYSSKHTNSPHGMSTPFPSGGGLYPVENYILVLNVEGLGRGIYHYDSYRHGLRGLPHPLCENEKISRVFKYSGDQPDAILCMTMLKHRNFPKYGYRGYLLSLLEAGHRMQNLHLVASVYDLGCCSLGAGDFTEVNDLLAVDGVNEHYVYATTVGLKKN